MRVLGAAVHEQELDLALEALAEHRGDALADVPLLVEDRHEHAHVDLAVGLAGVVRHQTPIYIGRATPSPEYGIEPVPATPASTNRRGSPACRAAASARTPTDFSPGAHEPRRGCCPCAGPLIRLRNTPFGAGAQRRQLAPLALPRALDRDLAGAAVRGPAPDAHVPLAGAERHEREPERLQRGGLRRVAGDPVGASEPQAGLDRPLRRPVAQPVPGRRG